jgi:hypothetical protein
LPAANHSWSSAESIKLQRLWYIALAASIIAAIGAVIDCVWGVSDPEFAATLLRYYWFRWNDVIWPIVLVFTITSMVRILVSHGRESSSHRSQAQRAVVLIVASLLPVTGFLGYRFWVSMTTELPPADRQTLIIRTEPRVDHLLTLEHWRAACEWVRTHTEKADLCLTPRYQQTFKWYAQRPEVVCWKDSPQDAKGLLQW